MCVCGWGEGAQAGTFVCHSLLRTIWHHRTGSNIATCYLQRELSFPNVFPKGHREGRSNWKESVGLHSVCPITKWDCVCVFLLETVKTQSQNTKSSAHHIVTRQWFLFAGVNYTCSIFKEWPGKASTQFKPTWSQFDHPQLSGQLLQINQSSHSSCKAMDAAIAIQDRQLLICVWVWVCACVCALTCLRMEKRFIGFHCGWPGCLVVLCHYPRVE